MSSLPAGWATSVIEDLLVTLPSGRLLDHGWSPQCEARPAESGHWGVLKTTAIQPGRFEPQHNKSLPEGLQPRPAIEVKTGDLLLTCAGPRSRCGVPALVRSTPEKLMLSGKMYRFRTEPSVVNERYLEYFLLSPEGQRQIESMKTGISDSGLNLTNGRFLKLQVPVAPLGEQLRIAQELERRLSHVDAAERTLQAALGKVMAAESALAEAAVTGALARDPALDTDAPAEVQWLQAKATAHSPKAKWRRVETAPVGGAEGPWPVLPLGQVAHSADYGTSKKCGNDPSGVAVIRIPNIRRRALDLGELKYLPRPEVSDGECVDLGDVLFIRSNGSQSLIGVAAAVKTSAVGFAFASYLIRFRFDGDDLLARWVELVALAPSRRRWLVNQASSSAGQNNLGQSDIAAMPVPMPSRAQLSLVLAEYERRQSLLEASRRTVEIQLSRCANLRRSLLNAAFSGLLVTQDDVDEPADVLLERVKARRAASAPSKSRSRKGAQAKKEPAK